MPGHVDIIDNFEIRGWIKSESGDQLDHAVIFVDGKEVGSAPGNLTRRDLIPFLGGSDFAFAFSFRDVAGLFRPAEVVVRSRETGSELGNGTSTLQPIFGSDSEFGWLLEEKEIFSASPLDYSIDGGQFSVRGMAILPADHEFSVIALSPEVEDLEVEQRRLSIGSDCMTRNVFLEFALRFKISSGDAADLVRFQANALQGFRLGEFIALDQSQNISEFAVPIKTGWHTIAGREQFERTAGEGTTVQAFVLGGLTTALKLFNILERHKTFPIKSILDWGVGCGRVAIPLERFFYRGSKVVGVDVDDFNVEWCHHNLNDVAVVGCDFYPPLPIPDDALDAVYGISVMTHLTIDAQELWLREIKRVLRPGGLCVLSAHCEASLVLQPRKSAFLYRQISMFGISDVSYDWNLGPKLRRKSYYRGTYQFSSQILEEWGRHFEVLEHLPCENAILQDFVVLRKKV